MVTASLNNYRQSPRKVRTVAALVKGKNVEQALNELEFAIRRAADPLKKLIESAVASAGTIMNAESGDLYVKELRVDKGVTMKRSMPRARGSASRINKRSSHVVVVLDLISNRPTKKSKVRTETEHNVIASTK